MPRPTVTPRSHERRFGLDELFFSTTDRKGIIISGNRVFARVSGWSAQELIGEPHNILRHPDMPRVVFKLLWAEIEAGRPIVAYVKNLARDGGFYWVIASVVPIPQGYLSVRFKPSSPLLGVVSDLYARLRAVEAAIEDRGGTRGEAMAASAEALTTALEGLGFAGYREFMLAFVPAELKSRDAGMRAAPSSARGVRASTGDAALRGMHGDVAALERFLHEEFTHLDEFVTLSGTLAQKSRFVTTLAQDVRLTSQNVSIAARRLESGGLPISVVGHAIQELADSSATVIRSLSQQTTELAEALRDLSFRIAIARLQAQSAGAFVAELEGAEGDGDGVATPVGRVCQSISALSSCLDGGLQGMFGSYAAIEAGLTQASEGARQLNTLLRTLDMARLTGKVEVSRLGDAREFVLLFDKVQAELARAEQEMREFGTTIEAIRSAAARGLAEREPILEGLQRIDATARRLEQANV